MWPGCSFAYDMTGFCLPFKRGLEWISACLCTLREKQSTDCSGGQAGTEWWFLKSSAGRSSGSFMNVEITPCHAGIMPLMCLCLYQGWNGFVA